MSTLNPIALITAKTLLSFGRCECNRVKEFFPKEEILSFESCPPLRREEKMKLSDFHILKLYPLTLIIIPGIKRVLSAD